MKKALLLLSLLVLTVSLTACGGSSGSSDSTPASLTGAVVAAPISGMDIYIGSEYTTADQDLKIGVTNATGAIEFDKAVVAKISSYPVAIATRGAGKNVNSKEYFAMNLAGIMMSATDSVYLTPFSTIAADLFEAKKRELGSADAAAYAKEAVRGIVKDTFGSSVNPFANPMANNDALMAHEILTQSLMLTLGVNEVAASLTEAETDAGDWSGKMTTLKGELVEGKTFAESTALAITPTTTIGQHLNDNKVAIAKRVSQVMTVLTGTETDAEKTAKQREFQIEVTVPTTVETVKNISIVASSGTSNYFKAEAVARDLLVVINTNEIVPASADAKFKITKLPTKGSLATAAAPSVPLEADDTEYSSNKTSTAQFKFTPEATAQDYTFTFETIPAAGEKALTTTLTLKAVADKTVIATKATVPTTIAKMIKLATGGSEYADIAKTGESAALTLGNIDAIVTVDPVINSASKAEVKAVIAVSFTAPTGFAFKKGAEAAIKTVVVEEMKEVTAGATITYQVPADYKVVVDSEEAVKAGKLSFVAKVIAAKNATNVANVPFRAENDAKIVLCADGMEDIVQSIALDSVAIVSAGVAPGTFTHLLDGTVLLKPTTWTTISGDAALSLVNTDLTAYVKTPAVVAGATRTTGFGLINDVKDLLAFDGTTAANEKITIAANNTVTFQKVKYTFAADVEASDINFKYAPTSKPEVETANVTVEKVAYIAPTPLTDALVPAVASTEKLDFAKTDGTITADLVYTIQVNVPHNTANAESLKTWTLAAVSAHQISAPVAGTHTVSESGDGYEVVIKLASFTATATPEGPISITATNGTYVRPAFSIQTIN